MKMRKIKLSCLFALLMFTVLISALATSCGPSDDKGDFASSYFEKLGIPSFDTVKFRRVETLYENHYVTSLDSAEVLANKTAELYFEQFHEKINTRDSEAVTDALLHCYVYAIGDRYSVYRDKDEYKEYNTDMSGTFYGIGVSVTYNRIEDTITVTEVYANSGAEDAGIKPGDLIIGVDGEWLEDIGYNSVVNKIRGEENTTVNVTVLRGGDKITFTATRKKVVEESVKYSIDQNKIGYIELSSFKDNTDEQFIEAIDYMTENGAIGIIYDLRSNPGGYLTSVVNMLSYISPEGTTIVSFTNDYGAPKKDRDLHSLSLPSVIICNENTASAGELFTAAMRDFDEEFGFFEVTTVGVKTYGKGVMQSTYSLGDGSTLTLTVAYYNPPCGENYDGIGIVPDVEVSLAGDADNQLNRAYEEIFKLIN